jgi:hypothetical protein
MLMGKRARERCNQGVVGKGEVRMLLLLLGHLSMIMRQAFSPGGVVRTQ